MLYKILSLVFVLTGSSFITKAQNNLLLPTEGFSVQHFTDETGLPQNSVKDIISDRHGFLWMITEDGIVRFDGQRFDVFSSQNRPITSNRFKVFYSLSSPKPTTFFAVTEKNEILKIAKGQVLPDTISGPEFIPTSVISKERIEWSSGLQNNFWLPDTSAVYLLPIPGNKDDYFKIDSDNVQFFTKQQLVWEKDHDLKFFADFFLIGTQLYQHNKQKVGEIFLWNEKGPQKTYISGDFSPSPNREWSIYTNRGMSQNFLYSDKKLYLIKNLSSQKIVTKLIATGIDIEALNTSCLYYDEEHRRLFIGSRTKGFFILKKNTFLSLEERLGSTMDNAFYAQAILDSHTVLTPQGSIVGFNPSSGQKIHRENRLISAKQSKDRYSMAKDASGNIWIKMREFLICYDPLSKNVISEEEMPFEITQLKSAKTGGIWLGTKENGIYFKQENASDPEHFTSIPGMSISCMFEDSRENLWIGTNSGLYKANIRTRETVKIRDFEDAYVRSLYEDTAGGLWITTYEKGFFLLKDGTLTKFPLDKSGFLQSSHCIIEDSLGYFWIPTNRGLYQVLKNDLLSFAKNKTKAKIWYKRYQLNDGFNTNEFNGGCEPCAVRLPNGFVSLPSLNGLVWFVPETIKPETPSAPLHIDRISLDDEEAFLREDGSILLNSPPNHLKIQLNQPYFGDPGEIQISYALEKSAKIPSPELIKWTDIPADNPTIHLFNLKPGDYTLIVKKVNGFGSDNYTETKIPFSVPKLWYQTWWFYILSILCLGLAIRAITRLNNRILKKKNDILENAVAERTSDLNQTLQTLRDSRTTLIKQSFIQEQIIASISHDLKTPLRLLIRLNKHLYAHLADSGDQEALEMCRASFETGEGLDALISNLLDYVKISPLKADEIDRKPIVLAELIEEKITLFGGSSTLYGPSSRIRNLMPHDFKIVSNYQLLGIIVQNLLDNSLKASSHELVTVSLANQTTLVFHNTGYSIPEKILQWINTHGSEGLEPEKRIGLPPHNGIGLMIVKQLAVLLNITLAATSNPTEGTYFYAKFEQQPEDPV